MKQVIFTILFTTLLSVVGTKAFAYDFAVENSDGVMIYYNYYNDGTELEVTRKSSYYFDRYSGVVNIPEEVTYMSRTRKVTSIGEKAFASCTGLTSVTIPNSVTSIGGEAFSGCNGLTSVIFPNSVTTIGDGAFWGCTGLISVTIPNSVTSIGASAFRDCSSLTSVTIGNSVTTIGDVAFRGCTGLASVHITDLASWCKIAFNIYESNPLYYAHHLFLNDEEIKDLVIPNSVTAIGGFAFSGCSGLTSVTIPNSVTTIGRATFASCSSLTSVTIPNSVTTIGRAAFQDCSSLTSVTIPNSVTSIGSGAFEGCYGLTSVTIPNSVTTIEECAFSGCTSLLSVTSKMVNPCRIDAFCFHQDVFYNATLYVPEGTTVKYKSTPWWRKFVFIEEGEPGGSVTPDPKKCATPTIAYANKEMTFSCDTEGVEYHCTITDTDIKSNVASRINFSATYEISVYATKEGFAPSDVATAILVWTNAEFTETTPSGSSVKAATESVPVLISSRDGNLLVTSELEGQPVAVYSLDGKALGSAKVKGGQAVIATNLLKGSIVVVKVGDRSVKVMM